MRQRPTAEAVRRRLDYDPASGILTWKNGRNAGRRAGYVNTKGYRVINMNSIGYKASHLAWVISTGDWPDTVDHRNHKRDDNRKKNLRDIPHGDQSKNHSLRSDNKFGSPGIKLMSNGRFQARIGANGKTHLGTFDLMEDAIAARRSAEKKMEYDEGHGSAAPRRRTR